VLRIDISEDPPRAVFVTRREANLYHASLVKPPGAEIVLHRRWFPPPWKNAA
jgi:hypothetical protein